MLRYWRLKSARARFLEACRNLDEGRDFWRDVGGLRRRLLEFLTPVPLLGLHEDGLSLLTALEWLEENCLRRPLGEEVVKRYHRLLFGESGGVYRRQEARVERSAVPRRSAERIVPLMKAFESQMTEVQGQLDAQGRVDPGLLVCKAVDIHHRLGLIHPFPDGNGRVARLSMNHFLRRYGAGYVIYPPLGESPEFWEALQAAHLGDKDRLVSFARSCVVRI